MRLYFLFSHYDRIKILMQRTQNKKDEDISHFRLNKALFKFQQGMPYLFLFYSRLNYLVELMEKII